jgi:ACS family D-galactonate transporter-like MFS transporter
VSFVVAGVGTILCGLLAWWYIRNSPAEHPSVNKAEAMHIENAHALEDLNDPPPSGRGVAAYFAYRSVWCMCLGWMFFNTVFYGLLTWMPTYLFKVHGLDIKQLGGALFIMFFAGFVGELVGGQIADMWRARGGEPNTVFRTLFGIAAVVATISIFSVAYVKNRGLSGRLHEPRRQHCGGHRADHCRFYRAGDRVLLSRPDVLRGRRRRPVRMLDRDRL